MGGDEGGEAGRRQPIRQVLQKLKPESRRVGVVSRIMAPQRGPCPNSQSL